MTGDALEVDREEDLEQLREQIDGDGDLYICEDALEGDLDGGGEASCGRSVGEYAGVDGGGEGEDSMLETSLSLENVNVSLL